MPAEAYIQGYETAVYDFSGKVAIVTGGVSGIGLAAAIGFARSGAHAVVVGRDPVRGLAAVDEISRHGPKAFYVKGDIASPADVAGMVQETVAQFGRLDFAFNNAAVEFIGGKKGLLDTPQTDFEAFVDTNIGGLFNGMKHQIRAMLGTADGGAIVNMTTLAGTRPVGEVGSVYTATRHAINGLTTSTAREWAAKGIRINAVSSGSILSRPHAPRSPELVERLMRFHPIGRLGEPGEVADAVLWLCSRHASFVIGAILNVDGGMGVA